MCNEVVTWIVGKNTLKVTSNDLAWLRRLETDEGEPLDKNYRATQDLNGRTVYCVGPNYSGQYKKVKYFQGRFFRVIFFSNYG